MGVHEQDQITTDGVVHYVTEVPFVWNFDGVCAQKQHFMHPHQAAGVRGYACVSDFFVHEGVLSATVCLPWDQEPSGHSALFPRFATLQSVCCLICCFQVSAEFQFKSFSVFLKQSHPEPRLQVLMSRCLSDPPAQRRLVQSHETEGGGRHHGGALLAAGGVRPDRAARLPPGAGPGVLPAGRVLRRWVGQDTRLLLFTVGIPTQRETEPEDIYALRKNHQNLVKRAKIFHFPMEFQLCVRNLGSLFLAANEGIPNAPLRILAPIYPGQLCTELNE